MCFLSIPGLPEPVCGTSLGSLSNQDEDESGEGSFCTEVVAGGAKNYAYRRAVGGDLNNIVTVLKVRGISINNSCADTVTFENLKHMVYGDSTTTTKVDVPSQIVRLPTWRIVSRATAKTWRVCLNKRPRIDTERTVPYGYTSTLLDDSDYETLSILNALSIDEDTVN